MKKEAAIVGLLIVPPMIVVLAPFLQWTIIGLATSDRLPQVMRGVWLLFAASTTISLILLCTNGRFKRLRFYLPVLACICSFLFAKYSHFSSFWLNTHYQFAQEDSSPAFNSLLDSPISPQLIPTHIATPGEPPVDYSRVLNLNSFVERLKFVKAVVHYPIVFPDGLVDFIEEVDSQTNWKQGPSLFTSELDGAVVGGSIKPSNIVRDYLNTAFDELYLKWKYNADKDLITTDFTWHRENTLSARDLVKILALTRPASFNNLVMESFRDQARNLRTTVTDPWIDAFDALLSKPENFSRVWKLRFIDDVQVPPPICIDNVLANYIRDDTGREHFIVINLHDTNFTYYLFDENGRFEKGCLLKGNQGFGDIFQMGGVDWILSGKTNINITSGKSFSNDSSEFDASFILKEHILVLERYQGLYPRGPLGEVLYETNP